MSSIFPENDLAEIAVKKVMLEALEKEKNKVSPYLVYLSVEIDTLKDDIRRAEKDLGIKK